MSEWARQKYKTIRDLGEEWKLQPLVQLAFLVTISMELLDEKHTQSSRRAIG
jgi:hypothetical protein